MLSKIRYFKQNQEKSKDLEITELSSCYQYQYDFEDKDIGKKHVQKLNYLYEKSQKIFLTCNKLECKIRWKFVLMSNTFV